MKIILQITLIAAAVLLSSPADAWKQKEFVISFWSPPPPSEMTPARYEQIADAGFSTVLGGNGVSSLADNLKMLDLSRQFKMKAFVQDDRLYGGRAANVAAVTGDYSKHPALEGYLVMDEPGVAQFPALRDTVAALKRADSKRLALINLFPTYASPAQLGAPTYDDYVKQYLDTVQPEVLSFDHYPFLTSGERPDYLENLEIIRRHSLARRIPFWSIVQAEGIEGAYRSPTENEMRSQVFTSLAYGAKGIVYFTYWTPQPGVERHFDGIIPLGGTPRARYEWVKRLNTQLNRLAPKLMKLRSRDVFQVYPEPIRKIVNGKPVPAEDEKLPSPLPRGTKADPDPIFQSVTGGPATIGVFDGVGRGRYLWVVNREPHKSTRVQLNFNEMRVRRLFEHRLDGQVDESLIRSDLKFPSRYEAVLEPGEARLFEVPELLR